MVKITNGINIFEVTSGAYDSIYSHQGYQVISGREALPFEEPDGREEKSADEIFVEEVSKKPISQWSKDEVKHYAAVKGIDISGTRSVSEAKETIRRAMSEEE